jgi:hypothetical protein
MAPIDPELLQDILTTLKVLCFGRRPKPPVEVKKPTIWEKGLTFRYPDLGFSIVLGCPPQKKNHGGQPYDGNGLDKAPLVLMCDATLGVGLYGRTYKGSSRCNPFNLAITDPEKFWKFIKGKYHPFEAFDGVIYNAFDSVFYDTRDTSTYHMPIDVPDTAYPAACEVIKVEVVNYDD